MRLDLGKIFAWAQGRTTAFCLGFFVSVNVLHYLHRLDATYIAFMGTLMGFVLGHSAKEDHFATKTDSAAPAPDTSSDKG